jgi:hypothetical protein
MAVFETSVTLSGMISLAAVDDGHVLAGRRARHNPHGFMPRILVTLRHSIKD